MPGAVGRAAIHRAWIDHQVLLFRDQHLSDPDLIAFSRRFGDLDHAPIEENGQSIASGVLGTYVVSNVIENGVAIDSLGDGEAVWNSDRPYLPAAPKASMLFAPEILPAGGDTSFGAMYEAFNCLPPAPREQEVGCGLSTMAPTATTISTGRA
jgi:taurine dioxygenase